jgi:CheY-like chemotaxis protein
VQSNALDVEFALSGERALTRILSSSPPHIVVCDIHMPGMNGMEVLKQACAADVSWMQRFLFLTGAKHAPEVWELRNIFAGPIFYKPVDDTILRNEIERCLSELGQNTSGSRVG